MIYSPAAFVSNARMRSRVRRIPIIRCMTRSTIQAKHSRMEDRVSMATHAGCGQAKELVVHMALFTCHFDMRTRQREGGIMVEYNVIPCGRGMADRTIGAEISIMRIILLVT